MERLYSSLNTPGKSLDGWGHLSNPSLKSVPTVWADVCPLLSKIPTAVVTVRMPFEFDQSVCIQWQEQQWQIIQGPTNFPTSGIAQFKIEKI